MDVGYDKIEQMMDEVHPGPPWRSGGPMRKISLSLGDLAVQGNGTYTSSTDFTYFGVGQGKVRYTGGFYTNPLENWPGFSEDFMNLSLNFGLSSPLVPSTAGLEDKVYPRTKPQLEQGGLAVAIAEIRDVPHMLKTSLNGFRDIYETLGGKRGSLLLAPKRVAGHFLNHNFGWVPFISDTKKFIDNVVNFDDRIRRLQRDNGNWIKRKVFLVNNTETNDLGWGERTFCRPASDPELRGCFIPTWNPYYNIVETKTTVAHGVGRFRYYQPYLDPSLPDAHSALGGIRQQLMLHGARVTPLNVYRAMPWTWLADWFTPAGDIVAAVQDAALDGMACKYLYLTHHQVRSQVLRQFLPFDNANGGIKELRYSRLIDVKQRHEAGSPFGFGLSWEDLSPKQLAILAALGISRR
jgi:hypothetical protein